jgi:hypothetical protein
MNLRPDQAFPIENFLCPIFIDIVRRLGTPLRCFCIHVINHACWKTESRFVLAIKRGKLYVIKTGGYIMAAITFDALKYADRLKAAGVHDKQAEAEA